MILGRSVDRRLLDMHGECALWFGCQLPTLIVPKNSLRPCPSISCPSDSVPVEAATEAARPIFAIHQMTDEARRKAEAQLGHVVRNHPAFTGEDIPEGAWTDF